MIVRALVAGIWVFSQFLMIFGGAIPYIPQYAQIYESQDASGFSLFVCLILISSNVIRIVYWFGAYFELTLLFQSIVMILTMFIMLELCIRMRAPGFGRHSFWDFQPAFFWNYSDFYSYIHATLFIAIVPILVMYFFGEHKMVVETIGFLALFIEALLAVPQAVQNYKNGSTRGMNKMMLLGWSLGDAFKLCYALLTKAPWPFGMCATIQLMVDFIIFIQLIRYQNNPEQP